MRRFILFVDQCNGRTALTTLCKLQILPCGRLGAIEHSKDQARFLQLLPAAADALGFNSVLAASLSGQRQLSAALRARDAVAGALDAAAGGFGLDAVSVCVDDALAALCDLTGENASEAVIEQVFERFCVGK